MTTEIKLRNICGHTSVIDAECTDEGTHITIRTTCPKVSKWGSDFTVSAENMMDINAAFAENNKTAQLTPTCFIPTLIMNAVWLENGMISKSLAEKSGLADIEYIRK
ncbi:MAG: hypothetical protein II940_04960 [Methanosarcinaceae archaeon]|nr:hypothetical protein [Methanosarcinaceae archaeon]